MLKPDSETLHVGDPAPEFSLSTADGKTIRLSDYRSKSLIITFIRGTW